MTGTPLAETPIDVKLVRALLEAQHPDLAGLDIDAVDAGWDNATFRLGDELAVRLPRRSLAAPLIRHEQQWLPVLAPRLPIPVPSPLRAGEPACGYPWHWSVVPWLPGEPADLTPPAPDDARSLGEFLRALHESAPRNAPANPYRGVPLTHRTDTFAERTERLVDSGVDVDAARSAYAAGTSASPTTKRVWIHGDLHPRNVLVDSGRITAVVDWGDLTAGDPATDLAAAWLLFDPPQHDVFRSAYGPTPDGTWERAKGWAALFAVMLLDVGIVDDPRFAMMGHTTLDRLAAD